MCFGFLFLLFLFRWFSNLVTCLLFFSNCVGCRLAIFRINLFELYCYPPCWPAATTIRPIEPSFRRRWAIKYAYINAYDFDEFSNGYFASQLNCESLENGGRICLNPFCFSSLLNRWWRIMSTATMAGRSTSFALSLTLRRTLARRRMIIRPSELLVSSH